MTATTAPQALPVGASTAEYASVKGRVIAWKERNGYDDSYFSSLVAFDAPDGGYTFSWVETGATAYAGGYIARPDCTDEAILAAYAAKRAQVLGDLADERAEALKRAVEKDSAVTIIKPITRGKNKTEAGATGTVTRKVENAYGRPYGGYAGEAKAFRVAVLLDEPGDARTVWLDEDRVRVIGYEGEDLPDLSRTVDYLVAAAWPAAQAPQKPTAW